MDANDCSQICRTGSRPQARTSSAVQIACMEASNSFGFSRTLPGTNVGLGNDVPSSSSKFVVRSPERGSVRPMVRDDITDMVCSFIKGFSGAYVRFNWMHYTDAPNVTANLLDDGVVNTLASVGAIRSSDLSTSRRLPRAIF